MTVFVQSLSARDGDKNIYKLQRLKRLYETTNANGVTTFDRGLSENFSILYFVVQHFYALIQLILLGVRKIITESREQL
jgi:hypothetical protein